MGEAQEVLRRLPAVEKVLGADPLCGLLERWDRTLVVDAVREVLEEERRRLRKKPDAPPTAGQVAERVVALLGEIWGGHLRRVVNATGILIHTNLGRAPLSREARQAVEQVLAGYSDLEFDLRRGKRRSRLHRVSEMLMRLTQAPSAMAVNNNAAAVFLTLRVLAEGRQVAVSRGELVEIGGSFRLPDIIEASGVRLLEVGTTNRTRLSDYQDAVERGAALLLKVHPSNFSIQGFVEETSVSELSPVARAGGVPLVVDLGSGALDQQPGDLRRDETTIQKTLHDGADLVTASGDKLLGGPQAGLIFGRKDLMERIRSHPLARVVRLDKTLLCALEATLSALARGESGWRSLPLQSLVSRTLEDLEATGKALRSEMMESLGRGWEIEIVPSEAAVGGGSLPGERMESRALRLGHPGRKAETLARSLRLGAVPVVGRIIDDQLHLDLRTLLDQDVAELPGLVVEAFRQRKRPEAGER